jgi:hypothetical protein
MSKKKGGKLIEMDADVKKRQVENTSLGSIMLHSAVISMTRELLHLGGVWLRSRKSGAALF